MHSSTTHFFWGTGLTHSCPLSICLGSCPNISCCPLSFNFHTRKSMSGVLTEFLCPSVPKKPFCPTVLLIAAGFCLPPLLSIHTHVRTFFQVDLVKVWGGREEPWEMSAGPDWTLLWGAIRIKTTVRHHIFCWHAAMLTNQFPDLSRLLCSETVDGRAAAIKWLQHELSSRARI